jgi:hypothetical protein
MFEPEKPEMTGWISHLDLRSRYKAMRMTGKSRKFFNRVLNDWMKEGFENPRIKRAKTYFRLHIRTPELFGKRFERTFYPSLWYSFRATDLEKIFQGHKRASLKALLTKACKNHQVEFEMVDVLDFVKALKENKITSRHAHDKKDFDRIISEEGPTWIHQARLERNKFGNPPPVQLAKAIAAVAVTALSMDEIYAGLPNQNREQYQDFMSILQRPSREGMDLVGKLGITYNFVSLNGRYLAERTSIGRFLTITALILFDYRAGYREAVTEPEEKRSACTRELGAIQNEAVIINKLDNKLGHMKLKGDFVPPITFVISKRLGDCKTDYQFANLYEPGAANKKFGPLGRLDKRLAPNFARFMAKLEQ